MADIVCKLRTILRDLEMLDTVFENTTQKRPTVGEALDEILKLRKERDEAILERSDAFAVLGEVKRRLEGQEADNQRLRELLGQSQPWLQEECDELEAEEDNRRADTYDLRMELETLLARIQQALDRPAGEDGLEGMSILRPIQGLTPPAPGRQ